MKEILKICDLYGTQFHWFFSYKPKYYTCHGGFLSILTIISWVGIFIFFYLQDFKNQPISNISTIPPSGFKNIILGEEKVYLPWRITDYDENFINHKGILFPKIYYYSIKYNNKTGLMETEYNFINYKLCNETSMKYIGKEFLLNIPIEELYCIDMEDLKIGGSWNADFINYIRFDLYLCKDGINYNENNNNCTSYDYLLNKIGNNNNWYFELLYPEIEFQPTVNKIPILVFYKTYYYGLNLNSNKLDRLYIKEYIIEDEDKQGFFLRNPKNKSYWGISSLQGDNYIIKERDVVRFGSTSRLYSLKIYLDYSIFYTRKYKKIMEIIGEIFPLLKSIYIFFSFFSGKISEIKSSKKLNEYIINNDKDLIKNYKKSELFSIKNQKRNLSIYNTKMNNRIGSRIENNVVDSKISCLSNINKFGINIHKPYDINKLNKKQCKTISINKDNINYFEFLNKVTIIKYPLKYYFLGFCLNKIKIPKKNNFMCISASFNKAFTFYTHLIDITSYISLYKQFESLKKIVMNIKEIDNNENK